MKRLLVLLIILVILFLFRGQITDFWHDFNGEEQHPPMAWLHQERDALYVELAEMDFSAAIQALKTFESTIHTNLSQVEENKEERNKKYHKNLLCELSVVYKRMAMRYFSNGNDDLHIEYSRKSQDQLALCTQLM